MAKSRGVSSQPALPFGSEANLASQVRTALAAAIRRSRKSIEQIADEMSVRLHANITPAILYNFTSESHPHRFPVEWMAAWHLTTGDVELYRIVLAAIGLPLPERSHSDLVNFARTTLQAELAGQEAAGYRARLLREGLR